MASYVDLSSQMRSVAKTENNRKSTNYTVAKKYRHLTYSKRVKQAALDVSNNGVCWWVHNYVYASLMYRKAKI